MRGKNGKCVREKESSHMDHKAEAGAIELHKKGKSRRQRSIGNQV